ncbi:hypothetical protein GCM10023314_14430 [Algibacter agarivorans]|uniref:Lipoprotein n=1 Tax=Algibacter agarivorans TaxID=1109741 RepID=A0ABP9GK82_9FLAO
MKKLTINAFLTGVLALSSCSSDDSKDASSSECKTCEIFSVTQEYCNNQDGTVTITTNGQEEIEDLDGATFAQFISGIELLGTCD